MGEMCKIIKIHWGNYYFWPFRSPETLLVPICAKYLFFVKIWIIDLKTVLFTFSTYKLEPPNENYFKSPY